MTDLESLLAEALCGGSRTPCRYHVGQAKLALNALAGAGFVLMQHEDDVVVERVAANLGSE